MHGCLQRNDQYVVSAYNVAQPVPQPQQEVRVAGIQRTVAARDDDGNIIIARQQIVGVQKA